MIFVRGNRAVTAYNQAAQTTVLRHKGTLNTTGANIPPTTTIPAGSFESLGNPYPSAINFTAISKPSAPAVDDVFYVWDPLLYGSWGYGAFQTIGAANSWMPIPGGTANYNSMTAYTTIQSGQAFFMHATGAGGTITFTEGMKVAGSQAQFRPSASMASSLADRAFLRSSLYAMVGGVPSLADGNVLAIDPEFSNEYNSDDALKLENGAENFAIQRHGKKLALEAHAPIDIRDTVFYSMKNLGKRTYQLKFGASNMAMASYIPYLIDRFTNTSTMISLTDTTTVQFTVDNNPASAAENRFYLVFRLMEIVPVRIVHIAANRNSDKQIAVEWRTENEVSIDHYELERSHNGRNFVAIYQSTAKANNGGGANYDYMDERPLASDNYYRVKAISTNGQLQYSAIVKVAAIKEQPSIVVTPNPVTDGKIQVQFINQPAGEYQLQLANSAGQTVYRGRVSLNQPVFIKSLETGESLASGIYQLKVLGANGFQVVLPVYIK